MVYCLDKILAAPFSLLSILIPTWLLTEIARTSILINNIKTRVILKVTHRGAQPFPIGHEGDAAVPWRRVARLSV